MDQNKLKIAAQKIDELCLNCEEHKFTCYVAVAKRAIATLLNNENENEEQEQNENLD